MCSAAIRAPDDPSRGVTGGQIVVARCSVSKVRRASHDRRSRQLPSIRRAAAAHSAQVRLSASRCLVCGVPFSPEPSQPRVDEHRPVAQSLNGGEQVRKMAPVPCAALPCFGPEAWFHSDHPIDDLEATAHKLAHEGGTAHAVSQSISAELPPGQLALSERLHEILSLRQGPNDVLSRRRSSQGFISCKRPEASKDQVVLYHRITACS